MVLKRERIFWIIISVILALSCFFFFNSSKESEKNIEELENKVIRLNERADLYVKAYYQQIAKDSVLKLKYDSLLVERQKIKKEYVEKIKIVDRYTVSDMQRYFDERTGKGSGSRLYSGIYNHKGLGQG